MEGAKVLRIRTKAKEQRTGSDGITSMEMVKEREEEEGPLSPGSRMFHEPDFNIHVLAIMGCKTMISVDVVKKQLPLTLVKHPRFSSLVVMDQKPGKQMKMKWVRTEVDMEKHIVTPFIDPSTKASVESADKFLEEYIHHLTKTKLDSSRPLWDLHLLNLRTSEAESVGIFRIHHSLGDGMSLMSLLLACTRQMADSTALPTIPGNNSSVKKRAGSGSKWMFWGFLMAVWWAVRLSCNTVVDFIMFLVTSLFLKDTATPLKGRPGVEFTPRKIIYKIVDLDDFKLIKNAMDATINDVALGITQAGLSRYLNRAYEKSDAKKNCLNNIRLRATLLINVRAVTGIQALADMMEKDKEARWGNWVGYVLLPFRIGLRDDPLDYIRDAKAIVDRKKHSLEAVYTYTISEIFLKLLGVKIADALSHRVFANTTLSFSNMVGPVEEIGFWGHPMAFLAPSCFGQPHALMINLQSYNNKMAIALSVDAETIPDPHQLADDIIGSLKLVKDAVTAKQRAERTPSS